MRQRLAGSIPRLVLVGAGALGSEVARRLAEARYPHVLIVDPDNMEERNLVTSRLYRQEAEARPVVGFPKAGVLADYAARVHGLGWQALPCEIADAGMGRLRGYDLLLSCTDSALARVETAFAARTLRLPMLDAAVRSQSLAGGRVAWFAAAENAACYLCGLSAGRRAEILGFALSATLSCAAPAEPEAMSGAASTVDAVAEAVLTLLASAREHPEQSFAQVLETITDATLTNELTRSTGCPWHAMPALASLVSVALDQTFAQAHKTTYLNEDAALDLPWPVCLRALCRACGYSFPLARRAAFVRRRGVCPACRNAGTLDPMECVSTVRAGDNSWQMTPRQLGLPGDELYTPRTVFRGPKS